MKRPLSGSLPAPTELCLAQFFSPIHMALGLGVSWG